MFLDNRKATIDGGKKEKGCKKLFWECALPMFWKEMLFGIAKTMMDLFIAATCWGRVLEVDAKRARGVWEMQKCREECCGEWFKSNAERCALEHVVGTYHFSTKMTQKFAAA